MNYKLLILGHKRMGKDTMAEFLNKEFGISFSSSSRAATELFIFNKLKDRFNYKNINECFNDRFNYRDIWYQLICEYNKYDKTRLAKEVLKTSDIYVGMRDWDEVVACKKENLFDLIIWVDASERLPLEDSSSFTIDKCLADVIIDNNGSEEEFKQRVINFGKLIFKKQNKFFENSRSLTLEESGYSATGRKYGVSDNAIRKWIK